MTLEMLAQVHDIVKGHRLAGSQYAFGIRQKHPEKGGVVMTHFFNKSYLRNRYETIRKAIEDAGLKSTIQSQGNPNEIMCIEHEFALPADKFGALLTAHRKNSNMKGLDAIVELLREE